MTKAINKTFGEDRQNRRKRVPTTREDALSYSQRVLVVLTFGNFASFRYLIRLASSEAVGKVEEDRRQCKNHYEAGEEDSSFEWSRRVEQIGEVGIGQHRRISRRGE